MHMADRKSFYIRAILKGSVLSLMNRFSFFASSLNAIKDGVPPKVTPFQKI